MLPRQHLFYGILLVVFIYLFIDNYIPGLILLLASTVLIDIDHYFYYVFKKKDFSFKNSLSYFHEKIVKLKETPIKKRGEYYYGLYVFHGFEIMLLMLLMAVAISPMFFYVLTGFNFHLFLDMISDKHYNIKSYKYSIFVNIAKSRKLKPFL